MENAVLNAIAVFGVLIILACGYGSANPQALLEQVGRLANTTGLWLAVLVRVVFGIVAILAAPASLSPHFLQIVGAIALLAAVVLPFLGVTGFGRIVEWMSSLAGAWIRTWLSAGMIFGAALVWVSGILA
jgi:hypothetical protein